MKKSQIASKWQFIKTRRGNIIWYPELSSRS